MVEHVHAHPQRATDANGDPVSGALLYTYLSGTLTAATVYSDEGLTTAHDNPIVADSAGVFPPIYYSGPALKITVTDPDAVTLPGYPVDPVALISTSETGAASVSFSPYTGFTATTVQTAIEQVMALWNTVTTWSRAFLNSATASDARTALGLGGLATLNILDEDNMATNSATRPPSQQSVKAYVDGQFGTQTLATNGSTKVDGLIVNWGQRIGSGAVTFTTPFPNAFFVAVVVQETNSTSTVEATYHTPTTTGMQISELGGGRTVSWVALGY